VPVQPDPALEGEACTTIGEGLTGLDTCEFGTFCWDMDPDSGIGMCVAFCTGSEANPTCETPGMSCSGGKSFLVCLPDCAPIDQDCPVGCACYPSDDRFQCIPVAAAPDEGAYGDECEFINMCQPGLFCANPDAVPGCSGSIGCCSDFCDLTAPTCPAADQGVECIAWYEEGGVPPGFENVGACAMPL
jgi:hypothetical protein